MLHDLLINAALLIAAISIGAQAYKDRSLRKDALFSKRVVSGVLSGLLGILLMIYSVDIIGYIKIDLRNIAIVMAGVFGGFVPSVIAGIIMGIFRILYFGVSDSSLLALTSAVLIGITSGIIGRLGIETRKKWLYSTVSALVIGCTALIVLLIGSGLLYKVLAIYCISTAMVTYFTMIYTEYLAKVNDIFRKYKEESTKDYLTNLNNVRQFDKEFNEVLGKIMEYDENVSLLYIDLDYFKSINDSYGHIEGDNILKQAGILFKKTCRSFDIISRMGGEEFSIILLDCNASKALEVAERIRKTMEMHKFKLSNGNTLSLTVSIGVESYPDNTTNFNSIIENADSALYAAKLSGRNKVVLFGRY